MSQYAKAIAAAVVTILAFVATEFGFELTAEVQAALVTLLTTAAVWYVPNRES